MIEMKLLRGETCIIDDDDFGIGWEYLPLSKMPLKNDNYMKRYIINNLRRRPTNA